MELEELKFQPVDDDANLGKRLQFSYSVEEKKQPMAQVQNAESLASGPSSQQCHQQNFRSLPNKEQDKVLRLLYLLTRFRVSDEYIHEQAMVFPEMPRSYLMKTTEDIIDDNIRKRYIYQCSIIGVVVTEK